MASSRPDSRAVLLAAALAGAALAISCSKDPTRPPVIVYRAVAVAVSDSLGAPAGGAHLTLTGSPGTSGLEQLLLLDTDAQGVASTVLAEGSWRLHAYRPGVAPKVGGGTFMVAGASRPPSDTVLVSATLHTPSVVRGIARLAGRTEHSGTMVSVADPRAVMTDSTGAYAVDLVPVGHWTVVMVHLGFKVGLASIVVAAPADTVQAPDVQMISDPNQNRVRPLGPGGPSPAGSRPR